MLRKTFALSLVVILACSLFFSVCIKSVSASSGNQIFWGAWVGTEDKMPLSTIQTFENQVGKHISVWNWLQWWTNPIVDQNHDLNFNSAWMDECRNHGSIPMVSWAPHAADHSPNFSNLQSILDHKEDAYLDAWGKASANWGHPYFVRLMWEFTGGWNNYVANDPNQQGTGYYPWGNGNTPAIFVAAWQYIVDKVRAAGGTDISWIWCPAAIGDSVSKLKSLYPGDQYVDWVGTDVYIGKGQIFDQGAQPELPNIRSVAPNKPVMLPETGYSGSEADSYWSNLLTNVLPKEYSYIKAVCLWQDPEEGLTVTDSTTLPSFRRAIASSYYSSNVYGSLNISPITAIGETPNPMFTPTSQPTLSLGFGVGVAIVLVAGVIVYVTLFRSKFRRRKREVVRREVSNANEYLFLENKWCARVCP
jgi:hypothetical protein